MCASIQMNTEIQIWRFDLRAVEALPKEGGRRPPVIEKDREIPAVDFFRSSHKHALRGFFEFTSPRLCSDTGFGRMALKFVNRKCCVRAF